MVNCKDVFQEISNYLDGDLDPNLKQELMGHFSKCHKCQVLFDTTRKTIELYCDGKLFPLPDAVRERLHQALRHKWAEKSK